MSAETIRIWIAREFTTSPGPRYRKDGEFSGQEFREQVLQPKFEQAIAAKAILVVNLDGVAGYATSFLEEAFGGLARIYAQELVDRTLDFICNDEPYQNEEIRRYIREARVPK